MMKVVLPQIFALLYTYFFVSYECSSIVAAAVSNFFVNSFPSVNNFRREERGEKELETYYELKCEEKFIILLDRKHQWWLKLTVF